MKTEGILRMLIPLFFLTAVIPLTAQDCTELEAALPSTPDDSTKVLLLDNLVKCINDIDGARALQFNRQAIALSEQLGFKKGLILSLVRVKGILLKTGQYDDLLARLDRGTKLCLEQRDTFWWIRYQYSLSDCYIHIGRSEEAVLIAQQALSIAESRNDKNIIPLLLGLISKHYFVRGEFEKTLEYQFKSLAYAEKIGRNTAILGALGDISITYNYLRNDSSAFQEYTNRGIALSESMGEFSTRSTLYCTLGDYYQQKREPEKAIANYLLARQCAIAAKYDKNQVHAAIHLAMAYAQNGQAEKSTFYQTEALRLAEGINDPNMRADLYGTSGDIQLSLGNFEAALAAYKQVMEIRNQGVTTPDYFQVLDKAAACAAQTGRFRQAFEWASAARILNDSLLNLKTVNEINHIERKYALQKKDDELLLVQKNDDLNKLEISRKNSDLARKRLAIQALELSQSLLEKDNELKQQSIAQNADSMRRQQALFEAEKTATAAAAKLKELDSLKKMTWLKWSVTILGIILANLMLVFLLFRSRQQLKLRLAESEKGRAIEQLRRETAQDVHDLVGRELNLIGLEARYGAMAPHTSAEALRNKLLELAEKSRHTGNHLSTMVLAINPETDSFPVVQSAFKEICADTFSDGSVRLQLDFPQSPGDETLLLPPDTKRQLSLILIESLNNVMKYAQATAVTVRFLREKERAFLLEIEDDGIGFDPERIAKTTNFGLTGMKTRAEKINAGFLVNSRPGGGTRIRVYGML